jgi:photosystem II stability/assembly factor-like uncharacterized protein
MKFLFMVILISSGSLIAQQNPTWQSLPGAPMLPLSDKFDDIYFVNQNIGWIVGKIGAVYKTSDGGISWIDQSLNNSLRVRCIGFIDSLKGWIGILNPDSTNILYETINGGDSWSAVYNLPDKIPPGICGIWIASDSIIYACGRYSDGAGIIKSTDKGETWKYIDVSAYARGLVDMYFFSPDTGFAVGMSTNGLRAVVLYTEDGGDTWEIKHTSEHNNEWAWKIVFPSKETGYVSMQSFRNQSYFLKTTDGGQTWEDKLLISGSNFSSQGVGFANDSLGWHGPFPGTANGRILETTDGGETWEFKSFAENINRFRMVNDTIGYASGRTVYKYTTETVVKVTDPPTVVPSDYLLYQNFPNPFNSMTTIIFSLPKNEFADLSIYDIKGEKLFSLINGNLNEGVHEVIIETHDWSSGTYFYTLKTENFIQTNKMILLK